MPRQRTAAGEDHPPGEIGDPPPQFTVDKVADPAQAKTDGCRGHQDITGQKDRQLAAPAKDHRSSNHAEQPAMKAHPALPDGKNFQRTGEVLCRVIEQDVAKAPAEHDAEDPIKEQVGDTVLGQRQIAQAGQVPDQQIGGAETDQIHQPVPADSQRSDAE